MRTNKILLYAFLFATILSSCKEKERVGILDAPDKAKVAVMQLASPVRLGSATLTQFILGYFYKIDGKLQFSQPLISNKTTGYVLVDPGSRTLSFDSVQTVANISKDLPSATVKTVNLTAVANNYYSVYLSGKVQAPEVLITTDDLTRPAAGKAKIRFVHLSPDAPAVDLAGAPSSATGTRPVLVGNRSYNTSSDFISVDAGLGGQFYAFELRAAGQPTVIATQSRTNEIVPQIGQVSTSTVNSFTLLIEPGKIYTLIARGYANPVTAGAPVSPSPLSQPVYPLSVTGVINSYF